MIKAILFDADGVVLKPRDKYFTDRLRAQGIDLSKESEGQFFKNEYKKVVVGKADLKEEVSKYLAAWGWAGSVDELLHFWFSYEDKFDEEVLDFVDELRPKGVKCYLASDHSRYRADDFMRKGEIKDRFDGYFFSGYVGFTKEEPEFFEHVLNELKLNKDEVLFVDDDPENVEVAKNFGIRGVSYEGVESLRDIIEKL
jgi:putative hydrolase of the HAD superfamily